MAYKAGGASVGIAEAGVASWASKAVAGKMAAGAEESALVNGAGESKPYSKSRPSYGKGQVEEVWSNAQDLTTGKVYDPTGAEITWDRSVSRSGQWDMGHIPGQKYSIVHELYMNDMISKKDFISWYRNPANYRPELPSTNRGHKFE